MRTLTFSLTTLFCGYFFITRSQNDNHLAFTKNESTDANKGGSLNKDKTTGIYAPAKVNYDDYAALVAEVKTYRAKRLVSLDDFLAMSKDENTVILDTRSLKMFVQKHVKNALNLSFPDFTQDALSNIIPEKNTRILIYCNNNFEDDKVNFPTKMVLPKDLSISSGPKKELTLALNIPTYINLYGYGYKNVYELDEFVNVSDPRIEFGGTSVRR
jgi:hypothetical protein